MCWRCCYFCFCASVCVPFSMIQQSTVSELFTQSGVVNRTRTHHCCCCSTSDYLFCYRCFLCFVRFHSIINQKTVSSTCCVLLPIPFLRWFERANAWHTNSKQCRMENACTLPLIISIMNELNSSNDYYTKKRSAPIDTAVVNWFV